MPPRVLPSFFTRVLPPALIFALLLGACAPGATATPTITALPSQTPDPLYASDGGPSAGWFLLDDLLADPGIQLGDYRLEKCQQGLALLQGQTPQGEARDEPVYALAAQLLAAELNLGAGAENCIIAQQALISSHKLLASLGFDGQASYPTLDSQVAEALPVLTEYLTRYNRGDLCR